MKKYTAYEALYRDFVYEAYTGLPEHGLDRLKEGIFTTQYQNECL